MKSVSVFLFCLLILMSKSIHAADMPGRHPLFVINKQHLTSSKGPITVQSRQRNYSGGSYSSRSNGQLVYQVKNLVISQIEENPTPRRNVRTKYIVSGSDAVLLQDDVNKTSWKFQVNIRNSVGQVLDHFEFYRPAYPCHYNFIPFQVQEYISPDNNFDLTVSADIYAEWSPEYFGGC